MKRIGFITSNIYQGMSVALWKAFSSLVSSSDDCSLFILPGGRLCSSDGNEKMRSSIFSLAGHGSLDAAIIWTSSLSGEASDDAIEKFVHGISREVPAVTIGDRIDGIPSILFDSYSGMRALVSHFIEVHGERRIAFIRGPEKHKGAEERFRAYRDALSSHGIAFDGSIVTSPYDWNDGRAAVKELVDSRSLVPGKDFTSIVSASDLLMTTAALYLEKQGVRIPEELRIAGFNDTEDNLRLSAGLTTVHLPIGRIAAEALRLAESLIEGCTAGDIAVSTVPVYRYSCGCLPDLASDNEEMGRIARSICSGEGFHESLGAFIAASGDLDALFASLPDSHDSALMYHRVAMEYRRAEAESRMRVRGILQVLDGFKTELLAVKSYGMIPPLMKEYFPRAGILSAFLVLFSGESSVMRAGFSKETLFSSPYEFPRHQILPEELMAEACGSVFVIEPLFFGSLELGYIVLSMEGSESYVAESLRASFSSAVKGITLFEEVEKSRAAAEKEEYEALLFYSNISKGVLQPLSEMKGMLLSESIDREKLSLRLLEADHILRLALVEKAGFSLEGRLLPFDSIVSDLEDAGFSVDIPGELPSFQIDRNLFIQMMKLILPWSTHLSGYLSDEGLVLSVSVGEEGAESSSIILAERIAFISSYGFSLEKEKLCITIPYPRLLEAETVTLDGRKGILFLSESGLKPPLPIAPLVSASGNPKAVSWISGDVDVSQLRRYKGLPMACFSIDDEYGSLDDILSPHQEILVLGDMALPRFLSVMNILRIERREDALGKKGIKLILVSDKADVTWFRSESVFSAVPVIFVKDRFSEQDAEDLSAIPMVLFANPSYFDAQESEERLCGIMKGDAMLPVYTASSVRRAISYINDRSGTVVSRWQIAEKAGVNEDYLTRIFHKEMGISPWEYLNRYRIQQASFLLETSSLSLRDIAAASGFQDPAYFCRVFRKMKGMPPGSYRKR